jgi:uncharacterized Zn-binding protein involved in type VI secretion
MPRIIRQGDLSLGHCWPPTPPIAQGSIQRKVFSENLPIIVQGDMYAPHPGGCGPAPTHNVNTLIGSENVFVGGQAIIRDGDPLSCGDVANTFAGNVFCNGGGRGPANRPDVNQTYGFSVSLPTIQYPPLEFNYTNIAFPNPNPVFKGCLNDGIKPSIFTTVTEEQSGAAYLNYPGQPLTELEGAPGIPEYASNFIRNPIPILELSYSIATDGGSFTEVIGNDLGNGIRINKDTGLIFGRPSTQFNSKTLRVNIRNFVGSRQFTFNITLVEVTNCP